MDRLNTATDSDFSEMNEFSLASVFETMPLPGNCEEILKYCLGILVVCLGALCLFSREMAVVFIALLTVIFTILYIVSRRNFGCPDSLAGKTINLDKVRRLKARNDRLRND